MNNSIVIGEDKMPIVSSPASLHKQSLEVCQQETLECTQQQQPAVVVTRGHFFSDHGEFMDRQLYCLLQ
jgi:hypothetical protein